MPLIDRDALKKQMCKICNENYSDDSCEPNECVFLNAIDSAPTIDAVPVVHGVWERSIDNDCPMHKCSVCGARVVKGLYEYENPNLYCYHCGAKMDGERRSDD